MNLKKKTSFKDNVHFKAVLRSKLLNDLLYLKENDNIYICLHNMLDNGLAENQTDSILSTVGRSRKSS